MNNAFKDLCFEIIGQHLDLPDVASTAKDINDAFRYAQLYQQNPYEFCMKHDEIVNFIIKARDNNILDAWRDDKNYLLLVPTQSGKPLSQSTPQELFNNLVPEIDRVRVKGIYQVIKHMYHGVDDIELLKKLLSQDTAVLRNYGLIS